MSTAKNVAKVVPGMMSMGLMAESMKAIPKKNDWKKGKISPRKQFKVATTALIGVPLIGEVSKQVNTLP